MHSIEGYHFTANTLRDGQPIPPIGEWLEHSGPIVPCGSGLHISEHPFDALTYAPGPMLHRVELQGDIVPHGDPIDKYVGRRRRIIATTDATDMLREFARWCALRVIDLWDAPDVVREYLETGDESKQDAAWTASMDAAWTASMDAAGDASRAAASAVVRATAWTASRAAASDASRAAASAAASAAVRATAWTTAWTATWTAARAEQRSHFLGLVEAAFA